MQNDHRKTRSTLRSSDRIARKESDFPQISPDDHQSRESVHQELSRLDHVRSTEDENVFFEIFERIRFFQLITSDEVLMFYEKGNFNDLIERMQSEQEQNDPNSLLNYHVQLVRLLAMCTEGKNASTEIKCHSLIGLDDLVMIVTHPNSVPEVKDAYITFLNHCYIDTEVEMKEIYNSQHIYTLIENSFCPDIEKVRSTTTRRKARRSASFFS